MAEPITIPKPEEIAEDQVLTDDQKKAIEDVKNEDWIPGDTPPAKQEEPPKKEELEKKEEKPAEPEKEEKPIEEEKTEDEKQEEEKAEQARLEQKAKELNKTVEEVVEAEKVEKAETERLQKIADEQKITIEEVKAEEDKDKGILERHANDPLKVARALRKEQSEFGKLNNEIKELRAFKQTAEEKARQFNEAAFESRTEQDRDKIISSYREKFPTQPNGQSTEELSDDACFEKGKAIIREVLKTQQNEKTEKLKKDATEKRTKVLSELPEEFKDYIPEIKELVDQCGDTQVVSEDFDVSYLANYVRGKKFTPDYIKSLEDSAYKRGAEKAKIIPPGPTKPSAPAKGVKGKGSELTALQKTRAEEIYGRRDGWTRQKMWDEYAANDLQADSQW